MLMNAVYQRKAGLLNATITLKCEQELSSQFGWSSTVCCSPAADFHVTSAAISSFYLPSTAYSLTYLTVC